MPKLNNEDACGSAKRGRLTRREFVKFAASGTAVIAGLGTLPVMAGTFDDNDYLKIIMEDKNSVQTGFARFSTAVKSRCIPTANR